MSSNPRRTTRTRPSATAHRHRGHSKADCLKILQGLSAYLDDELAGDVCREIRKHLGACPNCEIFLDSLRHTVTLCRHVTPPPLSPTAKARLRGQILKAAGRS